MIEIDNLPAKKFIEGTEKLGSLIETISQKIEKLNGQSTVKQRLQGIITDADEMAETLQDYVDELSNIKSDLGNAIPRQQTTLQAVQEFHRAFEFNDPKDPEIPEFKEHESVATLRVVTNTLDSLSSLIKATLSKSTEKHVALKRLSHIVEELGELSDALEKRDKVKTIDALEDLEYVLMGSLCALGMASIHDEAFKRVHASNMSKLKDGKVIKDSTGKVVKGDWYKPVKLDDLFET